VTVVDVRRDDQFQKSHVRDAVNAPIHDLTERVDKLPNGELWVHCARGYRALVAASILDRSGRTVVLVDDQYAAAEELGLTDSFRWAVEGTCD